MSKLKNPNIILALIFSSISVIMSLFTLCEIIKIYPVNFSGTLLFTLNFMIFLSGVFIVSGIVMNKKALMIASSAILIFEALLYAVIYIYKSVIFNPNFTKAINFLFLVIPAISFLFLIMYITDNIKNKRNVIIPLSISFIILLANSFYTGGFSVVLLISAYGLLLYYVDIRDVCKKVKMGEVFFLSLISFGIFYILWILYTIKKVRKINSYLSPVFAECLFFIILPPYASYWFYTRYEDLSKNIPLIKNRGTICMTLSLLFLSPLALCILQRDLNEVSEKFKNEDQITSEFEATEENNF